jgi:hypothetical protein
MNIHSASRELPHFSWNLNIQQLSILSLGFKPYHKSDESRPCSRILLPSGAHNYCADRSGAPEVPSYPMARGTSGLHCLRESQVWRLVLQVGDWASGWQLLLIKYDMSWNLKNRRPRLDTGLLGHTDHQTSYCSKNNTSPNKRTSWFLTFPHGSVRLVDNLYVVTKYFEQLGWKLPSSRQDSIRGLFLPSCPTKGFIYLSYHPSKKCVWTTSSSFIFYH